MDSGVNYRIRSYVLSAILLQRLFKSCPFYGRQQYYTSIYVHVAQVTSFLKDLLPKFFKISLLQYRSNIIIGLPNMIRT